jgi:hypothetical protein
VKYTNQTAATAELNHTTSGIGAIFHPIFQDQDCPLGRFNKFPYVSLITFTSDPHRLFMRQILFWVR